MEKGHFIGDPRFYLYLASNTFASRTGCTVFPPSEAFGREGMYWHAEEAGNISLTSRFNFYSRLQKLSPPGPAGPRIHIHGCTLCAQTHCQAEHRLRACLCMLGVCHSSALKLLRATYYSYVLWNNFPRVLNFRKVELLAGLVVVRTHGHAKRGTFH